jgi:hypothetical protein
MPTSVATARRTLGISSNVSPAPYGDWNNTYALVSFSCTGATSCTSPIAVNTEGADQEIPGTASDGVTDEHTTAVVNIDLTPPMVSITSPSSGSTTLTSITVTGTVSDALSGLSYVTCNGNVAMVDDGNVECSVDLKKGRNAVILTAVDLAGNSASSSIRVTRTGTPANLTITPGKRILTLADARTVSVVDDFGQAVTGLSWSSDDTDVATVSTVSGVTTVTGVGAGTTTITASSGGLSADMDLTVVSTALAGGDVVWRSPPPSGSYTIGAVYPAIIASDVPDIIAIDYDDVSGERVAKGLTTSGEQLWQEVVPGEVLFADVFGGVVASTSTGIARIAGPDGTASWRFDSPGNIVSSWAQSSDGTLYAIEQSTASYDDKALLAVDGETGLTKFRAILPQGQSSTLDIDCFSGFDHHSVSAAETSDITIGEDGAAYFQVDVINSSFDYLPCGTGAGSRDESLSLWRATSIGSTTSTSLWTYSNSGPGGTNYEHDYIGTVAPDGTGNILAAWQHVTATSEIESTMSRVVDGAPTDQSLASGEYLLMTANEGLGYFRTENGVKAIDLTSWTPVWTYETEGADIVATDPSGAIVLYDDSSGELIPIDNEGNAGTPVEVGYVENISTTPAFGYWYGIGYDDFDNAEITATIGPEVKDPAFAFSQTRAGNPQRQRGPLQKFIAARPEAMRILRRYIPISHRQQLEYGGIICSKNGVIEAGPPSSGWVGSVFPGPCLRSGSTKIGLYHTHVDDGDFSGGDALCAKNGDCGGYSASEIGAHHPSWLGVACGRIIEHTYDGEPTDSDLLAINPMWYTQYLLDPGRNCPPLGYGQ